MQQISLDDIHPEYFNILSELVIHGINPCVKKIIINGVPELVLDLDSRTKSGMYLTHQMDVYGRYDEHDQVDNLQELVSIFVSRYKAREFGSQEWLNLAVEFGFAKRVESVTYELL